MIEVESITNQIINSDYKTIQVNKKQVRLHRYIMEEFLGRKLSSNEVVHHKDGNKLNNDIDNLEVLTRSEHLKKHYKEIGGKNNQFKKIYNLDKEKIKELYQNPNMTHKKLAEMFNCSTGTIAYLLGKGARAEIKCKICGQKARYIKSRLCAKHYLEEYNAKHK